VSARALIAAIALAASAGAASAPVAHAQTPVPASFTTAAADTVFLPEPQPNALRAIGEATLVNAIVWSFNRYIREGGGQGFRIGWHSWAEAYKNGFVWDPNNFTTNQFAHPYHGNLYFNAGRANGLGFWGSSGIAFLGSYQWEYFGETHPPSINDWMNTSLGGTALGEMTHRLATTVRDNRGTGMHRVWSEIGGFFIDPVGGFNRLITGGMGKNQPNPELHTPPNVSVMMRAGSRTTYAEHISVDDTTGAFVNLKFKYGDIFSTPFKSPYDVFDATIQVNFKDVKKLGLVSVSGLLARKELSSGPGTQHVLGAYQFYDYIYNRSFELGGQSIGAGLSSRFVPVGSKEFEVRTTLQVTGVLIGATKSDYSNQTARDYDYGPGFGARFNGSLIRRGSELLNLSHYEFYIHSLNGNRADHFLSLSRVAAAVPLGSNLTIGADYQLYLAHRQYADFPDVTQRTPQVDFYITTRL